MLAEQNAEKPSQARSKQDQIIHLIAPLLAPLGYELVHVEIQTHRQKTLRLFIDHLDAIEGQGIGIEDCVRVSRALDEPLEKLTELDALFQGAYELEVSSPGVERPLRTERDYAKFAGREVTIHTYRALTDREIENSDHLKLNPKQKNFHGRLRGIEAGKVRLDVSDGAKTGKGGASRKAKKDQAAGEKTVARSEVKIPLELISKANLEPKFDFE